jgi:DNA-binding transcriptional regulator YiaG
VTKRIEFSIAGANTLAKPYRYTASGLDNIYLRSGVAIEKTPYGPMVTIDDLDGLHHAIGLHIVEQQRPVTGAEFRFLRKQMGLTQRELARLMSVTDQTVANYEKGKTTDLGPADPLIRLIYLVHVLPDETRAGLLKAATSDAAGMKLRARLPAMPKRKLVQRWRVGDLKAAAA